MSLGELSPCPDPSGGGAALGGEVGTGQLDDPGKRLGVVDGDLGERLAVQLDVGPVQAGDQLAVAQAAHPAGGVDADDPEAAELALARLAVAVRVDAGPDQGDNGLAVQVVPAQAKAFGQFAEAFAGSEDRLAAARSYHDSRSWGWRGT